MTARDQIRDFISAELLDGHSVSMDENLLREGGVDSLGMLRLVAFLEQCWDVQVSPDEFTIENFRSVRTIGAWLERALGKAGPTT